MADNEKQSDTSAPKTKKCWTMNMYGYLLGELDIPEDQHEVQDRAVYVEPPPHKEGFRRKWNFHDLYWMYEVIPKGDPAYKSVRRSQYPALEEFADAFYWYQKGNFAPMAKWISDCDHVKNTVPKDLDAKLIPMPIRNLDEFLGKISGDVPPPDQTPPNETKE